jgi:hypothetical protein
LKGLEAKIAAVQRAEADCARQRAEADAAWHRLKGEVRRTATPVRIVVSGLALGFASGITTSGGAAAAGGKFLSGPVFSMLLDTVVPGLLAGITAAATSAGEQDEGEEAEAAEPEEDGGAEQFEQEQAGEEQAPEPRQVRRGRRRA